ncbi:MAG: CHAT domain-containing tetratricopeptide repeat protein [Candidatus Obscuribacterales bacterium]|jgi:CHAT domain-containing protein/Tfp pilus assembly protein PilF
MTDSHREKKRRGRHLASEATLNQIEELSTFAYDKLVHGDSSEAKVLLLKALELSAKTAYAEKSQAVVLTYLGQTERMMGDHASSIDHLNQAIELCRQSNMLECELQARLFLAEQLTANGDFTEAQGQFELAYNTASFLQDRASMELAAGNLGSVTMTRCHLEAATDWFNTALELAGHTESGEKSVWLGSLGLALSELGQFEQAVGYYRRAYLEAELNEDALTMSICRGSEGNIRFEQSSFEEALALYKEAQTLAAGVQDRRREGIWLGNQGVSLARMDKCEEAIELLDKALMIARELSDLSTAAAHLDSLGDCYKALADFDQASQYYDEALALSRSINDRLGERIYLANLGKLKAQNGQLAPAFEYFRQAVELFDEQRGMIKADDLKTSFANRGQELYRDMVSTCLKLNKRVEALEYVGRAKSRALLDLLSNSPIDVNQLVEDKDSSGLTRGIKELISREADLRAQIAHLERQFFHGNDPDYSNPNGLATDEDNSSGNTSGLRGSAAPQEDTRKLYLEWREVLNQLRRRHPNYANLVSATTLNYAEIQALWKTNKLSANTCVIEFFFPQDYLLVACVQRENSDSKSGLTTHVVMDPQSLELIREDIATFFEMSSTEGWEVPVSLCRRLYQSLLGPVLENLNPGIERLLLIPHGSLYHLPFSALHDQSGYVCERFAVSYVPTVSLIPILASAQNRKSETDDATGDARYLVTAISDYSATREGGMVFSSRLRSSAGLEDLAYTMEEANSILSLGQSSTVSSGASTGSTLLTNEEVKRSLPEMFGDFDVVHFAGHAIFNHDEPMASGLVLSDGSILSAASILEGNALRTERGRLLVLSACQTGVNVVTEGGEILGLARALMYAGMPNLVLSLWEVADRSTAELMQDFHTCWQSGKISVAQALRQAQLKAIAAKQPVHAWAPFIHFGIE